MPDPTDAPRRVQRKRIKGWRLPPNTRCVDRSTRWGNPFFVSEDCRVLGPDGREATVDGLLCLAPSRRDPPRAFLTAAFYGWAHAPEQAGLRAEIRAKLRGKNLACWCPLDQPCHADVLLELANADQVNEEAD